MTEYETKSLKLFAEINQKLGLLLEASGLTVPEKPAVEPVKISAELLAWAKL